MLHDDHLISVIVAAHTGKVDKHGRSQLWHLMAVAAACPPHLQRIGWSHDCIEDAGLTTGMLLTLGMEEAEVEAVDALSRRIGESYATYILRLSHNAWAVIVKLCDLNANLSRHHLLTSEADQERLGRRYTAAAWSLYKLTGMDRVEWMRYFSDEARAVMDRYIDHREDFFAQTA